MTIIQLPQVGESVTEGIIGKWLKGIGDTIEEYEPLVEIVTDKVTMELPSPETGIVTKILAEEGAVLPMGSPIAEIIPASGKIQTETLPVNSQDSQSSTGESFKMPKPTTEKPVVLSSNQEDLRKRTGVFLKDVKPPGPTGSLNLEEVEQNQKTNFEANEVTKPFVPSQLNSPHPNPSGRYSPIVKRLAAEKGVNLSIIQGSGFGGRVTKQDVLTSAQNSLLNQLSSANKEENSVRSPLTPIRKIIASNMHKSVSTIPHAWTMMSADLTNIVNLRNNLKANFQAETGSPLTFLAFILNPIARLLKKHKVFNATLQGDHIVYHSQINIGIAVAAPDGLIVPVIPYTDKQSITQLAKSIHSLSIKAREQKLKLEEVQNGTFTVNNTGALGSESSFSIINYPQAAILNTEAVLNKVVAQGNNFSVRPLMNLCLSFDHRIIDGLQASLFLRDLVRSLEDFDPDASIK